MMTAKEMFEALGYECSKCYDRNRIIRYYNEQKDEFVFWIKQQEFSSSEFVITVDEFKAIQKQMEELGWI